MNGGHRTTLPSLREKVEGPAAIRDALQALAWYADPGNWTPLAPERSGGAYVDRGDRARDALERLDAVRTGSERQPVQEDCPECDVAYGEPHRAGCFFLTGDPADLRAGG